MQTDIVLESFDRTILIDTKFYGQPLSKHYKVKQVHSGHPNHIFAYVANWASRDQSPEEWRLNAPVNDSFNYRFELLKKQIRVCSIDLSRDRKRIRTDLLSSMDRRMEEADRAVPVVFSR